MSIMEAIGWMGAYVGLTAALSWLAQRIRLRDCNVRFNGRLF